MNVHDPQPGSEAPGPYGHPYGPAPQPDPALAGYPPPVYPRPDVPPQGYPPPSLAPQGYPPPGAAHPLYAYPPTAPVLAPYRPPVRPGPMPQQAVVYHQLLRGPRRRWWKPVLSLVLTLLIAVLLMVLAAVPVAVFGLLTGAANPVAYTLEQTTQVDDLGPVGFFYTNLSLIALIPATTLSIWIVHGVRPRFVSSVAGGIRWRWLGRCALLILPLWIVYMGLAVLVEPTESPRPARWVALLVIVVLMTPFQAAGEEYLFRGWVLQNVGSWFARPVLGLVVSLVVSSAAFSAAHLSPDPWILGSIACLAVASGLAAWRTGGLEAGIAMHAVNNLLAFGVVLLFGGWQEAFVGEQTAGTPMVLALSIAVHGGALALILWQARKQGIDPHYRPAQALEPTPPPAVQGPVP